MKTVQITLPVVGLPVVGLLVVGWMVSVSASPTPILSKSVAGHWMCDVEGMTRVDLGGQDPPQSAYTPSVASWSTPALLPSAGRFPQRRAIRSCRLDLV